MLAALLRPEAAEARASFRDFGALRCTVHMGQARSCVDASGKQVPVPESVSQQLAAENAEQRRKADEETRRRCGEQPSTPQPKFPQSTLCQGGGGLPASFDQHFQKHLPVHYNVLRSSQVATQDPELRKAAEQSLKDPGPKAAAPEGASRRVTPAQQEQKARETGGFVSQAAFARQLISEICAEKKNVDARMQEKVKSLRTGSHEELASVYEQVYRDSDAYGRFIHQRFMQWKNQLYPKAGQYGNLLKTEPASTELRTLRAQFREELNKQWDINGSVLKPLANPIWEEWDKYSEFTVEVSGMMRQSKRCVDSMKSVR